MRTSIRSLYRTFSITKSYFGGAYRDLSRDSRDWFGIGRVRKIVPDLCGESVAINAIWRLVGEIPEAKISLPLCSSKLLVAADFQIKFFFKRRAATVSLDNNANDSCVFTDGALSIPISHVGESTGYSVWVLLLWISRNRWCTVATYSCIFSPPLSLFNINSPLYSTGRDMSFIERHSKRKMRISIANSIIDKLYTFTPDKYSFYVSTP